MLIKHLPSWVFRNDSGFEIPPYACMEITGSEALDTDLAFVVRRPTVSKINYGDSGVYLFNGGEYVPVAAYGVGHFPCPRVYALVDTTVGLSADEYDHFLAPVPDEWFLGVGWMFQLQTATDPNAIHTEGDAATRLVNLRTQHQFRVRTSGSVTAASGGNVTMYKYNGTHGYATASVTVHAESFIGDVATNKDCLAVIVNNSLAIIEVC